MLAMSARSICAGLRSAVTGRLVRLRIGLLMDGRDPGLAGARVRPVIRAG
jgi:hypothetical protein